MTPSSESPRPEGRGVLDVLCSPRVVGQRRPGRAAFNRGRAAPPSRQARKIEISNTPGEVRTAPGYMVGNRGRPTVHLEVSNRGTRPVQVGSHFHFFEVNRALAFDRSQALGMRLDIPSGKTVRWEPGETRRVDLVALGGAGRVRGHNRLLEGSSQDPEARRRALRNVERFLRPLPPGRRSR